MKYSRANQIKQPHIEFIRTSRSRQKRVHFPFEPWVMTAVTMFMFHLKHNTVLCHMSRAACQTKRPLNPNGIPTLWCWIMFGRDLLFTTTEAKADTSPLTFIAETRYWAVSSKSQLERRERQVPGAGNAHILSYPPHPLVSYPCRHVNNTNDVTVRCSLTLSQEYCCYK